MEAIPICANCKHHIKNNKCKAFDVIPSLIWSEADDHSKPLPNQTNDIVFEPINNDASK